MQFQALGDISNILKTIEERKGDISDDVLEVGSMPDHPDSKRLTNHWFASDDAASRQRYTIGPVGGYTISRWEFACRSRSENRELLEG